MNMFKTFKSYLGKVNINRAELITLIVVLYLNFYKPKVLVHFSKTFLGKLTLIIVLICSMLYSNLLGVLVAVIVIILTEKYFEGLNNMNSKSKKTFLKKHCKNINGKSVLVDLCGNEVNLKNIKNIYKNVTFDNGVCNPCNSTCNFEITHSNEQLSVDEKLKPKNSNKGNIVVPTFHAGEPSGPNGNYTKQSAKFNALLNQTNANAIGD